MLVLSKLLFLLLAPQVLQVYVFYAQWQPFYYAIRMFVT